MPAQTLYQTPPPPAPDSLFNLPIASPRDALNYDVAAYVNEREIVVHTEHLCSEKLSDAMMLAIQIEFASRLGPDGLPDGLDTLQCYTIEQRSDTLTLSGTHCFPDCRQTASAARGESMLKILRGFESYGLSVCVVLAVPVVRASRTHGAQQIVDAGVVEYVAPATAQRVSERLRELARDLHASGLILQMSELDRMRLDRQYRAPSARELTVPTLSAIREVATFDHELSERMRSDAVLRAITGAACDPAPGWVYMHDRKPVLLVRTLSDGRALVFTISISDRHYKIVQLKSLSAAPVPML